MAILLPFPRQSKRQHAGAVIGAPIFLRAFCSFVQRINRWATRNP